MVSLNSNVLYPALRQFEQVGAVTKTVEPQEGRPPRHVYRLTPVGEETLYAMLRDFPPEVARSQFEFLTRVAFFDLLEPEARTEILEARDEALAAFLDHMRSMEEKARRGGVRQREWNLRAVELEILQLEQEREWISRLKESPPDGPAPAEA
jgi:DNA-binding PadR family transcriptional regulator